MKITKLKKDDILIGNIGVGSKSPESAKKYLEELKNQLKEHIDNEIILISIPEIITVEFEILRKA